MDLKTRRLVSLRGCDHRTEALACLVDVMPIMPS